MKHIGSIAILASLVAYAAADAVLPSATNLLANPSFEMTEPPRPVAAVTPTAADWTPRAWNVWGEGGAVAQCPDDPSQAHTGRRCVALNAPTGAGRIRYVSLTVPDARPWTVRLWARGKGRLSVGAFDCRPDRWVPLPAQTIDLTEPWKQHEIAVKPPDGCRQWVLDLCTQGPTQAWVDDVSAEYAGSKALGIPTDAAVGRDANTLLYLDFETPFDEDAFYVGGRVSFSKPGEGRFGRSLILGGDGYVACSANENLDPSRGTIEVWCKLLSPGDDVVFRPIVSVPGMEGMSLHKDQYAHISFSFSSGWATLSHATAMGYAGNWQPGAWRHFAACWDSELLQLFVDGKLVAWADSPRLSKCLGPELRIGGPDMEIDDLRISNIVRYRQPVPAPRP